MNSPVPNNFSFTEFSTFWLQCVVWVANVHVDLGFSETYCGFMTKDEEMDTDQNVAVCDLVVYCGQFSNEKFFHYGINSARAINLIPEPPVASKAC